MTDRPIIFSAPMIRALLDGRKTQTRRLVKNVPPMPSAEDCHYRHIAKHERPYLDSYCGNRKTDKNPRGMSDQWAWWTVDDRPGALFKVPYVPGDMLWVRENWRFEPGGPIYDAAGGQMDAMDDEIYYAADRKRADLEKWKPSIHMPRWASRITLEVTGVKVERLQDISLADAIAEGATGRTNVTGFHLRETGWSMDWSSVGELSQFAGGIHARNDKKPLAESDIALPTARSAFANFINLLHGGPRWNLKEDAPLWDQNPFVAAISFKVHKCNIDKMGAE